MNPDGAAAIRDAITLALLIGAAGYLEGFLGAAWRAHRERRRRKEQAR